MQLGNFRKNLITKHLCVSRIFKKKYLHRATVLPHWRSSHATWKNQKRTRFTTELVLGISNQGISERKICFCFLRDVWQKHHMTIKVLILANSIFYFFKISKVHAKLPCLEVPLYQSACQTRYDHVHSENNQMLFHCLSFHWSAPRSRWKQKV